MIQHICKSATVSVTEVREAWPAAGDSLPAPRSGGRVLSLVKPYSYEVFPGIYIFMFVRICFYIVLESDPCGKFFAAARAPREDGPVAIARPKAVARLSRARLRGGRDLGGLGPPATSLEDSRVAHACRHGDHGRYQSCDCLVGCSCRVLLHRYQAITDGDTVIDTLRWRHNLDIAEVSVDITGSVSGINAIVSLVIAGTMSIAVALCCFVGALDNESTEACESSGHADAGHPPCDFVDLDATLWHGSLPDPQEEVTCSGSRLCQRLASISTIS